MHPPAHRRRRRGAGLILALPVLMTAAWLMAAGPAFACSCAMPGPMSEYNTPESAVFSGVAGPLDARGVPVRVTTWYHGTGAAPLVYLAKSSFGDSAACGTTAPPNGTSWIWVTYLAPEGGDYATGLCSPSAQIGTPEGNAMVAEAEATFGGATPPGTATGPPEGAPSPPISPDAAPLILVATIGLGVVLLGGIALLARRRPKSAG